MLRGARAARASATARSSSSDEDGETELRGVPTVLAVGARPWIAPDHRASRTCRYLTSDDLLRLTDLPASLVDRRRRADRVRVRAGAQPPRRRGHARAAQRRAAARRGARGARDAPARAARGGRDASSPARAASRAREVPGGTRALLDRRQRHGRGAARRDRARAARRRDRPGRGAASSSTTAARASTATCETTARGVWALGDAIGGDHRRFQFTHVATHEGPQVAENALRGAHHEPAYTAMPRVTFTDPEVAVRRADRGRGARARASTPHTHVKLVRELGKARAIGETRGVREGRDRPRDRQAGRRDGRWPRTPATCSRR